MYACVYILKPSSIWYNSHFDSSFREMYVLLLLEHVLRLLPDYLKSVFICYFM